MLNWTPYYTGVFDLGKRAAAPFHIWGGLEARDPLQWHTLGASLGIFREEEAKKDLTEQGEAKNESTPGSLYYLYNRYKLGLSLNYLRDGKFTEIRQAYLSYISPGRFFYLFKDLRVTGMRNISLPLKLQIQY